MPSPWLPLELIEMVFDHFHFDEGTLAACSVVCKAWTDPARSHLFASVDLHYAHTVKKLLQSGSAVIPFIRHLHVGCGEPSFWNELGRLIGLKHIRSLSLEGSLCQTNFSKARSSLRTIFATIVYLRFDEINTCSFSELAEVICSLPHLETLVINEVDWDEAETPSSSLCLSDNLRVLEMRECEGGPILKWLLSLEKMPALRTVYMHECDLKGMNRFLQALGPSLEEFWCGTCINDAFQVGRTPNLSYNTRLQVLHIELDSWNVDTIPKVTQWVTGILSQIISEQMNRVVFEVIVHEDDPSDYLEWTEVDSILAMSQFSRLKKVDINVFDLLGENPLERLGLSAWFIARLPQCHARGILSIHVAEWKSTYL